MTHPARLSCFDDLTGRLVIETLVPEEYASYRALVADAFWHFVGRLPHARAAEILAEQAALPVSASPAQRLVAIMHLSPTLHKLGQVLARDRRLAPELRRRLQRLESLEPRTPGATLRRMVQAELGDRFTHVLRIADHPIAEASVAVVVPFSWHDHPGGASHQGVFKILRPGVETRLHEELEAWSETGAFLDERRLDGGLPAVDFQDTLETVRDLLLHEVSPEREQANLREAAACFRGEERVRVPAVLPFGTAKLTAMERLDGPKVTDAAHLSPRQRRRLAETVVEALVARPLWSAGAAVMFHADPHAGNLRVDQDGRLVLLDWSLVGRLGKAERERMTALIVAALSFDATGMARTIAALALNEVPESKLRRVVDAALGRGWSGWGPGLDWLIGLLDDAVMAAGIRFPADLLLFRKTLHMVRGVAGDVSEECHPDEVLRSAFACRLASEWPARSWAPWFARGFATHVSNADLASLAWTGPAAAARWWARLISPSAE